MLLKLKYGNVEIKLFPDTHQIMLRFTNLAKNKNTIMLYFTGL